MAEVEDVSGRPRLDRASPLRDDCPRGLVDDQPPRQRDDRIEIALQHRSRPDAGLRVNKRCSPSAPTTGAVAPPSAYGPHHGDLVAELRRGLPPGIEVAGAYLDGIGVPACAASATKAAQSLAAAVMGA